MELNMIASIVIPLVTTTIIGMAAWLLKKTIENLENTDKRMEKKIDDIEPYLRSLKEQMEKITYRLTILEVKMSGGYGH